MPDAIKTIEYQGHTFIISANEGDARDYKCYSEETRIGDLTLDPTAFPNTKNLQENENLGRLKTTKANGDTDGDGDVDQLYSYGARSFSIWSAGGQLVYDSGNELEKITAERLPNDFNSTNDENDSFDNRSDDKGSEPEGVEIGIIKSRTYAFIGLERVGGIFIYDVTNPYSPSFVQYINNRDFSFTEKLSNDNIAGAGDLGPEEMLFIPAEQSPNSSPLLVAGNEVSGTTTIYHIHDRGVQGSYTYFLDLAKGINMVSVPLKPVEPMTTRALLTKLDATLVIRYKKQNGYYQGYTPNYTNNGFRIEGGQGYIVNAWKAHVAPFIGGPWTNGPSTQHRVPLNLKLQPLW